VRKINKKAETFQGWYNQVSELFVGNCPPLSSDKLLLIDGYNVINC
jgi:hypothetical protein